MPWTTITEYYSMEDGTQINKTQLKSKEYVKYKKNVQTEHNKYTGWSTKTIIWECRKNPQLQIL